jgi:hypothetical protein
MEALALVPRTSFDAPSTPKRDGEGHVRLVERDVATVGSDTFSSAEDEHAASAHTRERVVAPTTRIMVSACPDASAAG